MEKTATAPYRDSAESVTALLIIDMINSFDFDGGDALKERAGAIVEPILRLRKEVEAQGWPVIYVNDNFGEWHSERSRLVDRALEHENPVTEALKPNDADFFIIKPQFSGSYATNLAVLLPKLGASRLILTGVATDICVLFTAGDAHMRDYDLWVPADAVAAESHERGKWALGIMASSMGAYTSRSTDMTVSDWVSKLA